MTQPVAQAMQPPPNTPKDHGDRHSANAAEQDNEDVPLASEQADVSKSERKREAQRLRELGAQLTKLSSERLHKLQLPESLLQALLDYQRFPSHGAKRRQLQLIGGILRKVDARQVQSELEILTGEAAAARYELHQLEQWRDALLANSEALTDYLNEHHNLDRRQLR